MKSRRGMLKGRENQKILSFVSAAVRQHWMPRCAELTVRCSPLSEGAGTPTVPPLGALMELCTPALCGGSCLQTQPKSQTRAGTGPGRSNRLGQYGQSGTRNRERRCKAPRRGSACTSRAGNVLPALRSGARRFPTSLLPPAARARLHRPCPAQGRDIPLPGPRRAARRHAPDPLRGAPGPR